MTCMPSPLNLNYLLLIRTMSDESLDLFEQEFWSEVEALAKELGVSASYIEEEFIIEGELQYPGTPKADDR